MKVLLVEDELELRETIEKFLLSEGFTIEFATTLGDASQKLEMYEYDCLLLDIGLPDGNGLNLIKAFKKSKPAMGIIVLSARNSLEAKIEGLDLGADDYLPKPFHLSELNARLKSVLRRIKFQGKNELQAGKLIIRPEQRMVLCDTEPVVLTKKEFDLLLFFVANTGRVLTRESIAEHLWGDFADSFDSLDFIYSQIKNLRKKVTEKTGMDYFRNIYGTGYVFNPEE